MSSDSVAPRRESRESETSASSSTDLERDEAAASVRRLDQVEQAPVAGVRRSRPYRRYGKPVVDRVGGLLLSLLTLPLAASIAVAIRAVLGRPVVIEQQRVGKDGRVFGMYKFRTMRPDRRLSHLPYPGAERRLVHKSEQDPRHTRLGKSLRRWSLDEIPQFWNVVKGDMSLVGPRPELRLIVEEYEMWQHRRHTVKPGLTGVWQVTARSNGKMMHEATDLDLTYVDHITAWGDLKLLIRTIPATVRRRGL